MFFIFGFIQTLTKNIKLKKKNTKNKKKLKILKKKLVESFYSILY